ncbi:Diaminopimelate decarboxylase [Serratia fonticola]|uniref:Diaminopimelate decarboxylase n=1 Tax=Serratia fonticola TaxID=47917 RepID=A0A4U9VB90_SERFO|nr:Diaminopimelate decarboxylase [Serratia fonticola]
MCWITATLARVSELKIPVNAVLLICWNSLARCLPGIRCGYVSTLGFGHGHSQKTNTGGENSKHGIWYADLPQAVAKVQQYGLKLIGLHMPHRFRGGLPASGTRV